MMLRVVNDLLEPFLKLHTFPFERFFFNRILGLLLFVIILEMALQGVKFSLAVEDEALEL